MTVGVDAELRLQPVAPVLAHDDQLVGLLDCLALTLDQGSSGEVVDVVDGADDADAGAGVSHPSGRTCRDAVLGVEDVHVAGDLGQPRLEVIYRREHSLLQGVCRWRRRDQDVRRSHGPEEALVGIAERHDANVHRLIHHRVSERQRVHHSAAWLGRIGDQGNAALTRPDSFDSQRHPEQTGIVCGDCSGHQGGPGRSLGDDATGFDKPASAGRSSAAGPGRFRARRR